MNDELRILKTKKRLRSKFVPLAIIFFQSFTLKFVFAEEQKEASSPEKVIDELIRTSVNRVLEILKDTELSKETQKQEVRKVIDPLFDIPLMAKLVLGQKHWPKFSEAQRKEFTDLFIKSLQDSYFEKVDLLTDEYVEFEKPAPQGNKFQMLTHIVGKDKLYKMLFKLYQKQGSWRVYDVEIEGISFVRSYNAQYDEFLQKNSVKDLLKRLREKALDVPEELKSKKKEKTVRESVEKSTP